MSENRRRLLLANSINENSSTQIIDQFSFTVCSLNIATSANLQHPWSDRLYAIDNNNLFSAPKLLHYDSNEYSQYDMWKYDIIGLQEVADYVNQLDDIINLLGDSYGYYSAYRGVSSYSTDNEACPIFYNKNKFTFVSGGKFWLSSNPDTESYNWVNVKRICVYAILKENATKQNILVLNTHLPSYQLYNSSVQKGEAIRWSLNVIRNKINNIITNNGKMPIVLLGDLNSNGDTKTANNKPIVQSVIGQTRTENGESLGTDYFFFNTTTYGAHNVIDQNYANNASDPDTEMPTVGADYTMLTDSNNNWSITPAFKTSSDKSYAQFDYILLSRWPEGDGVYNSNTRMWCGHETNYSYITPVVEMSDGQTVISDHCAVVSKITVHNPNGYEVANDTDVNFTIRTKTTTKKDDTIVIVGTCNKTISTTFNIEYKAHVGETIINGTLPVVFNESKYAYASTDSLYSYENTSTDISDFERSVITALDFKNRTNFQKDGIGLINATYRNDFMPLSGIYLNGVDFNINSSGGGVVFDYLVVKNDYKSYLTETKYNIIADNNIIEYDDKSIFKFDSSDLSGTWYFGTEKTLLASGTIIKGYSNQNQYDNSYFYKLVLRIPCDFLLIGEKPIMSAGYIINLSIVNNPSITLIGGNQINYSDYRITKGDEYIEIEFTLDDDSTTNNIITTHSSFEIDPLTIYINIADGGTNPASI